MRQASLIVTGLLLACPLLWWPGAGFDAFRLPAVLFLAAALLAVVFVRSARGGDKPPGPAPLRTAGFLLVGIHLLSLFAARSLADAIAPVLLLSAGVAVFAALRGGVLGRDSAERILPVIPAVGLVLAAVGIVQALRGMEAVSTEGNRNYAGALAAMLLPASVALTRSGPPWSRVLSAVAAAALGALLLLSESRGGLFAAGVGLAVAGAAMAAKRVPHGPTVTATALLLLVGVSLFFQSRQFSAERMKTAGFRLDVWKNGLRMIGQRPVLGWGAGGFETEYPPFRSESEFRYSHEYPPPGFKELENAHSSWVQTAVETGVPGLLALLLVLYVAFRLWRYYVKVAADPGRGAVLGGLGGAAAAYLVAGLFNTLTMKTSHTVLFWIFLGLIEVLGDTRPRRPSARAREARVALPAAAAVVALFGAFWTSGAGLADAAFTEGMTSSSPTLREARLREALERNPYHWRARYQLGVTLAALGRFAGAVEQGRAMLVLRPFHAGMLGNVAIWIEQSQHGAAEAETFLRRALEVAPFYSNAHYNLGLLQARRGNTQEARASFTKAIQHDPRSTSSYYCRGILSVMEGDATAAVEDLRKARALGYNVGAALGMEQPSTKNDSRYAEFFR